MTKELTAFDLAKIAGEARPKLTHLGVSRAVSDLVLERICSDVDSYHRRIAQHEADGHPAATLHLLQQMVEEIEAAVGREVER
jgi:hypothetical protein